jgi:two-component system sensor histidine kinase/response regulator
MIPRTPPVKFLIVDDREENLLVLEALLRQDGLEILKARSGEEALELLLVHDVALALLDVQMPEMDGFALAELMRGTERSRHVPIIFVTAGLQEQHREFRGYDAGAVDFLFKPIDPRILRHKAGVFFDLYKQRQELSETLRVNETFVAAISHDLRNPLNSIVMGTEMILGAPLDEGTKRTAERVRSSSRRMVAMIDDLFDLARVRLGQGIPLERRSADLVKIAENVIAECLVTTPKRSIELRHDGNAEGQWDPVRIEQIVSNLVGNAIRHGSESAPIVVIVNEAEGSALLSIHNDGAIDADVRQTLFDPFRGPNRQRVRKEGLGLGLFIVQQLVSAHGGSVEFESSEAEGTTFRVRLPKLSSAPSAGNGPAPRGE